MSSRTLEQWLSHLESIHPTEIELGLERVAAVAERLELLQPGRPVISVAGTNGKGSTVAVMEAVLCAAGKIPGAFTSPHLWRFNERVRVGGREVSDDEIVDALVRIEAATGDISLTYFEYATLAALSVFARRTVDVLLLEVGLGGRLDAVNIIDADIAVITSIDLDHQDWLGASREAIGREKAGIMRSGRPVVIADPQPPGSVLECAKETGATPVLRLGREFAIREQGSTWIGQLQCDSSEQFVLPEQTQSALLPENICAGLQALLLLDGLVSPAAMREGLADLVVPGRRQCFERDGLSYLMDVAHNPAAVNSLHEYIAVNICNKRKYAIFSAMHDKDLKGMIKAAQGLFDGWFVADQLAVPRAASAQQLAALIVAEDEKVCGTFDTIKDALSEAGRVMQVGDCLVVFGSFFTVAEALPLLQMVDGAH